MLDDISSKIRARSRLFHWLYFYFEGAKELEVVDNKVLKTNLNSTNTTFILAIKKQTQKMQALAHSTS